MSTFSLFHFFTSPSDKVKKVLYNLLMYIISSSRTLSQRYVMTLLLSCAVPPIIPGRNWRLVFHLDSICKSYFGYATALEDPPRSEVLDMVSDELHIMFNAISLPASFPVSPSPLIIFHTWRLTGRFRSSGTFEFLGWSWSIFNAPKASSVFFSPLLSLFGHRRSWLNPLWSFFCVC